MWDKIVTAREVNFFDIASLPLLAEYCRLKTQVDDMADQVDDFGDDWLQTDDGLKRYKMLTGIRDQAQGRMIALARTMRLTQQARFVPDSAVARPGKEKKARPLWHRD